MMLQRFLGCVLYVEGDRANKIWRQLSFENLLESVMWDASIKVGWRTQYGFADANRGDTKHRYKKMQLFCVYTSH